MFIINITKQEIQRERVKEIWTPAKNAIILTGTALTSTVGLRKNSYEYDFDGNPIKIAYSYIDENGSESVFETIKSKYNKFNQRIKAEYSSDNTFELWSYACCGLASYTDKYGNVVIYERDQRKRVVRELRMTASGTRIVDMQYSYDASDNVIKKQIILLKLRLIMSMILQIGLL